MNVLARMRMDVTASESGDSAEDCDSGRLSDFVDGEGNWDWHRISHLLPPDTLELIALSTPPIRHGPCDSCHWTLTANGSFSVASAYSALRDEVKELRARVEDLQRWYSATLQTAGGNRAGGYVS